MYNENWGHIARFYDNMNQSVIDFHNMQNISMDYFHDAFMDEYKKRIITIGREDNHSVLLPICKEFGFNLSGLNILQVGCGPWKKYLQGPKMDELLRGLGANMINLDIMDKSEFYRSSRFFQGSWLDIDNIFKRGELDVVFVHRMNPEELNVEVGNAFQGRTERGYSDLFFRTMSVIKPEGMLLVTGTYHNCFSFPSDLDEEVNRGKHISSTTLSHKLFSSLIHVYRHK